MLIQQTETAIDAFHAHRSEGKATVQQQRILAFIGRRGGDWSIGELAHSLDLEKSTVSARVNELIHDKKLTASDKRRDRISGITIRPVRLPAKQMGLF